jgi:predicted O-methyltransferase YrrM
MRPDAVLLSYDPQTKLGREGERFDEELRRVLTRYGLDGRAVLLDEDSHTAPLPDGEYRLVLVDGDHSPEGARLDFERFCRRLAPGGHALFHDAVAGGPREAQLAALLEDVAQDGSFVRAPDVGTFADFVRR